MEPPTKRPRFGPAPFDDLDDPDADELNERPEDVNARRDPAVRLERSRAFAAFKLKSAFERIFEKYERDFTGVGDEIDLRTGQIVVDNGHVQSLKDAPLGAAADDTDADGASQEGDSEAGSLDDEERLVRGRVDDRLSRAGQLALPSMPPPGGPPAFFAGPWPGAGSVLGTPPPPPPPLGGIAYAGQMMGLGRFPMHHGTPAQMPTADPAWRTPELPPPYAGSALVAGGGAALVKKRVARLSLSAAREQADEDEDDILLDAASDARGTGKTELRVVKQKILSPRPPGAVSAKKNSPGTARKPSRKPRKSGKHQEPAKSPSEMGRDVAAAVPGRAPEGSSSKARAAGTPVAPTPPKICEPRSSRALTSVESAEEDADKGPTREREPATSKSGRSTERKPSPSVHPEHDVYVNLSGEKVKLTSIPRNQLLRVEIPAGKPPDFASYRLVTPELSEDDQVPEKAVAGRPSPNEATAASKSHNVTASIPNGTMPVGRGNKAPKVPAETFSRNIVDPAYAFSDEDEPSLPKRRDGQRKPKSKQAKTGSTRPSVLREISGNVGPGVASSEGGVTSPHSQGPDEPAAARAQSLTGSPQLGDLEDRFEDLPGPLGKKQLQVSRVGTEETGGKVSAPGKTATRKTGKPQNLQGGSTSPGEAVQPEERLRTLAAHVSKTNRRRSFKTQPRETQPKTPRRLDLARRKSLPRPARQEIPETSPQGQPTVTPLPAKTMPAPSSASQGPSPLFVQQEQAGNISDHPGRAPSPTLTDPASKPPAPTPHPPSAPPAAGPSTPVKTPSRRSRPASQKQQQQLPLSTAQKPSTSAKRKSILSLVPPTKSTDGTDTDEDEEDEDEDELSFLTPARPPHPATTRSTPAGHHVRLGLLRTPAARTPTARREKSTSAKTKTAGPQPYPYPSSTSRAPAAASASSVGGRPADGPRTPSRSSRRGRLVAEALAEAEGLVQTPGGTVRRCGVDGFRCEREFCFRCL